METDATNKPKPVKATPKPTPKAKADAAVKAAVKTSPKTVGKAPAKAAVKPPAKVPTKGSTKGSTKAPTKAPAKTPAKASTTAPVKKATPRRGADVAVQATPVKPAAAASSGKEKPKVGKAKSAKAPKDKLVRDGFTMPESEFKLIDSVKQRAMAFKREVKKSEVLRAGLKALQGLSEPQLKALLETLPTLKTGRPKKGH